MKSVASQKAGACLPTGKTLPSTSSTGQAIPAEDYVAAKFFTSGFHLPKTYTIFNKHHSTTNTARWWVLRLLCTARAA